MKKMDIIYEDKELLVVNKPAKKLTIATQKKEMNTLYHEAREYIKKQNPKSKIFIVHRLDKDTSGVVLFAKSEKLKKLLQDNWNSYEREYLAIVDGVVKGKNKVKSYLVETKSLDVYSTNDSKKGKLAITNYESLAFNKSYSLLKINIETGRRNQIRVHMSDMHHPITGDKKYHSKNNPLNRMGLHASSLKIVHPITKKEMVFVAKTPAVFKNMFNNV